MKRTIDSELLIWKDHPARMPLLVRGARQVGKTYVIESFGMNNFVNMININFEQQRAYLPCFDSLDPHQILTSIKFISRESILPGKTLLFLDEIQECPRAIMSLRYFKEDMPELHIIAAGSLLEFALQKEDFRMPVGRVQSIYMKPLSFKEFLIALKYQELADYLTTIDFNTPINPVAEQQLHNLLHQYYAIGGMPAVVNYFAEFQDWRQCQIIQSSLLSSFYDDFAKYAATSKHKYLQSLLEQAPAMIGERFRYAKVDPDMQSRDLKPALEVLIYAGVINKIHQTNASGLPLSAQIKDNKFKLLFVDIGLVKASQSLDVELLQKADLMLINRGALAEQFVGQELLAYSEPYLPSKLFYWEREKRGSESEVDYVINVGEKIIPIEVKAGKTGSLKSLQVFLNEKQQKIGIRCSMKPLSFHDRVLSVPLYMISEIRRLVNLVG